MLTRFVRIQLIIFTIATIVGISAMLFGYLQIPTLLGIGRITVTMELPGSGGLYRFANVTYRGAEIGKVTDVTIVGPHRAQATLSLADSPRVPADLQAQVRSMSAVGEQFVELQPRTDAPPYLHDGSIIALQDTTIPQAVGPMLDQVGSLVDSIPQGQLGHVLDESFNAFNGAGDDLSSLIDASASLGRDLNGARRQIRGLADDAGPLLATQAQTGDAIRIWSRSLAGFTEQLATNDPQIRSILQKGPGFADELSRLLSEVKPTLPILLANLTTIAQVGVTYNPSLEQLLVLLPPYSAAQQSYGLAKNNPTGLPSGEFSITLNDPPACTVGFLPPSQWRNPADTTTIDTPSGLYCKLPQDSPLSVRGARNYPCMGHPGKRAPTVEICDSDKPYVPLAMREHALGPNPIDPNLIAQGVPPDDRVNSDDHIFGPLEGTPPPPPNAAPSAYNPADHSPSVAIAAYNPDTGSYRTPDGTWQRLTNPGATPSSWKDLLPVQ
ncbi:MlaD family protein [Mycobacterium sp. RTGN5]|uniref:MlaD family protein n=1 Tax=Mycobacterium sp. RTGN5 TaxID=3016522 RepID=UPI0029C8A1DA|nr:MlaD family protein [Mycobacterium sp. RTGN5]